MTALSQFWMNTSRAGDPFEICYTLRLWHMRLGTTELTRVRETCSPKRSQFRSHSRTAGNILSSSGCICLMRCQFSIDKC